MSKTTMSKSEIEQKIKDLKTKLSCQESDIGDWKIAKCMEYAKGTGKKQYFLLYTVLFAIIAFLVFSWYFLKGRTIIYYGDGWRQHFKALVYYGRFLRSIVREFLLGHGLVIPAWDFSIGEGSDILGTLNYYVIGDPFAFFSVFVPTRFMHIFYQAMNLLRIYLAGIAFSCLCFHTGQKNRYAVMAGAMTYVFCLWAIYNAAKHPYFLNPMIYFPLLILGVEKILKKQKPYLFIATVFVSAVSNFYFFYMLVLTTVVYVIIRLLFIYKRDILSACKIILQVGAYSVIGVLLAAVIILPICYVFLGDTRMSGGTTVHLFYPLSYYFNLPGFFVTVDFAQWIRMGFAAPVLVAVFFLFCRRKEHGLLKVLFLICIAVFMLPFLGYVLNGFTYVSNRWCWAFSLLCAYILTVMWPSLMKLNKREAIILLMCTTIYFIYCYCHVYDLIVEKSGLTRTYAGNAGIALLIAFVFLLLLFPAEHGQKAWWRKRKQQLGLLLVIMSILNVSYWEFSPNGKNFSATGKKAEKVIENLTENETMEVKRIAEEDGNNDFYRYSGIDLTANANMISGLSSTQYYWSLSNTYMIEFKKRLELAEAYSHKYQGYCERAELLSLSSVGYYVLPSRNDNAVPYGFSYVDTSNSKYAIYRNDYALPLGYTYDTYMPLDKWDKLSAVDKQEALLQSLVLEEGNDNFKEGTPVFESTEIPYTLICGKGITQKGDTFVVKSKKASITLEFDGLADSETYVAMSGFVYQDTPDSNGKTNIKMKSSLGTSKEFIYLTKEASGYIDRHDFTVNFGYSKEAVTSVTIKFPKAGVYNMDSLKVFCQSMDSYGEWIAARKTEVLENVEISPNTVTGTVSLKMPKLLCLSIPYAKGWRAYVDGKETELSQANVQYMALALDSGEHDIRLVYATPLLKEGICVSVAAFMALIAMVIIQKRKLKLTGKDRSEEEDYMEDEYKGKGRG